jgi:hypothetical protein
MEGNPRSRLGAVWVDARTGQRVARNDPRLERWIARQQKDRVRYVVGDGE